MNLNRIWVLGSAMVMVALVAGGYFLGISPMLASAAASDSARTGVQQQNAGYEAELASLKTAYEGIATRRIELVAAQVIVPSVVDDPSFVGELHELQAVSGATIAGFTVSDDRGYAPTVVEVPEPTAEETAAAEDGEAPADTATDGSTASTTADTAPAQISTPAIPGAELMTAENLIATPYTVSVTGSLEQTQAFVSGLQRGSRLFLVTKLTFTKDAASGDFIADIDGFIWTYRGGAMASDGSVAASDAATVGSVSEESTAAIDN